VYEREVARNQLREAYPQGPEELSRDWSLQQGWAELASHGAELAMLHQFVRTLVGRLGRQPGPYAAIEQKAEFEALPRLNLGALLAARGYSHLRAGLVLAALIAGTALASLAVGALADRVGRRTCGGV